MKIKLFDGVTVTAEPEEVYMLLKLHHEALADPFVADRLIVPETPESAAPAVVAVETPEAPKKVPARKAIDWGKAQALRKAGWYLAKIADELGVSVPTVSAHLKEVKA